MNNLTRPLAVLSGARTPFCKAFTEMASLTAVELGTHSLQSAIKKLGITPDDLDEVIFGNVSGQPDSANLARVISLRSGVPEDRIAHTVNRNCASGMESIIAAWHSLLHQSTVNAKLGHAVKPRLVAAGGTESMSNIPMFFGTEAKEFWMRLARSKTLVQKLKAMASFRTRMFKPVVGIELGLTDPVSKMNMGQTAELLASDFAITRHEQDEFALSSHLRAANASKRCFMSGEIVAIDDSSAIGTGDASAMATMIAKDNGPRANQTLEQLAKLRPLFKRDLGSVTAGNSCPLTDGAATLILADAQAIAHHGQQLGETSLSGKPLGFIVDYEIAGCDPRRMGLGPVYAIAKLLDRTGYKLENFDRIEINEAFAAQVIACRRALESEKFCREHFGMMKPIGTLDPDRTNVNGGAIALGHPVGTTGTRLVLTLLRELRASGLRRGLATLCVGGGQGVAMIVETELEK
ncbi:MAG TPA: acetyl-CoA C-acyltransferase [Planctomycetaceae bacterium]|nr:acetyl-CoA C-acyltransferase [Planctomycetaceae bacterium]